MNTFQLLLVSLILASNIVHSNEDLPFSYLDSLFIHDLCLIPQKPEKVGLWTSIEYESQNQKQQRSIKGLELLESFIKKYADLNCQVFDSIYAVIRADSVPQKLLDFVSIQSKTKKIYLIQASVWDLNAKYLVPEWAKQEVFIHLDPDVHLGCHQLAIIFQEWKQKSTGKFGPIASHYPQTIVYDVDEDQLEYTYSHKKRNVFNMVSTEIAIIPKHLMQLYHADIFQFGEMRRLVNEYQNCEDIAMNFMVNLIYDEIPFFIFEKLQTQSKPEHYRVNSEVEQRSLRTKCVYKFFQICGRIPSKYQFSSEVADKYDLKQFRSKPLESNICYILTKMILMERKYLDNEAYLMSVSKVYPFSEDSELSSSIQQQNLFLSKSIQEKTELIRSGPSLTKLKTASSFSGLIQEDGDSEGIPVKEDMSLTQMRQSLQKLARMQEQGKNVSHVLKKNAASIEKRESEISFLKKIAIVLLITTCFLVFALPLGIWRWWKNEKDRNPV